jgi:hypothetical protein
MGVSWLSTPVTKIEPQWTVGHQNLPGMGLTSPATTASLLGGAGLPPIQQDC